MSEKQMSIKDMPILCPHCLKIQNKGQLKNSGIIDGEYFETYLCDRCNGSYTVIDDDCGTYIVDPKFMVEIEEVDSNG